MGIIKGQLTCRRYAVLGELPEDYVAAIAKGLKQHAFRPPPAMVSQEESMGWTLFDNITETDFEQIDRWHVAPHVLFQLRIDKKTLPSKLFNAELQVEIKRFCESKGYEKCPKSERAAIKERLKSEYLSKTLPSVRTAEVCWSLEKGYVLFHNTSESVNNHFMKRFYESFGIRLSPWSPLSFVSDDNRVMHTLKGSGGSDLSFARGEG